MKKLENLECNQCSTVFKKKSTKHFKCPKCGAHFTKPTKKEITN